MNNRVKFPHAIKIGKPVEAGSLKCSHPGHEVLRQSSSVTLKMSHNMAYNTQFSTGNNSKSTKQARMEIKRKNKTISAKLPSSAPAEHGNRGSPGLSAPWHFWNLKTNLQQHSKWSYVNLASSLATDLVRFQIIYVPSYSILSFNDPTVCFDSAAYLYPTSLPILTLFLYPFTLTF